MQRRAAGPRSTSWAVTEPPGDKNILGLLLTLKQTSVPNAKPAAPNLASDAGGTPHQRSGSEHAASTVAARSHEPTADVQHADSKAVKEWMDGILDLSPWHIPSKLQDALSSPIPKEALLLVKGEHCAAKDMLQCHLQDKKRAIKKLGTLLRGRWSKLCAAMDAPRPASTLQPVSMLQLAVKDYLQRSEYYLASYKTIEDSVACLVQKRQPMECVRLVQESCIQAEHIWAGLAGFVPGVQETVTRALQLVCCL